MYENIQAKQLTVEDITKKLVQPETVAKPSF
jgi:hypothetical protein